MLKPFCLKGELLQLACRKSQSIVSMNCKWCSQGQCWTHGQVAAPPKGSGKGKGGGSWGGGGGVWNPMNQMMSMMMKGKGKGKTGIRSFDGNIRVWIGGVTGTGAADKELNMRLKEHMASTGLSCIYAEIGKGGQGGAAFKTEAEAEQAIATFNGSVFEGQVLHVDKLTKKSA